MSRSLGVKRHFIVLIWTLLCKDTLAAPSPPKSNLRCPFNKTEWEDRAVVIPCQGSDVYHCLLAQDRVSVRELCVEKSLVLKGNCPFFTNQGYLHWEPCNNTLGCPNSSFVSNEVYQYRVCFGKTDHLIHDQSDEGLSDGLVVGLVVLGVAVIIALGVLLTWISYKRGVCRKDEDVKNATSVLQKKNVVYICGLLGNSVSTVGKKIASDFAENKKMSAKYINYLDLYDGLKFSDKTIYFVDGWYGLWNDNPCEKSKVSKNLNLIIQESKRKNKAIKFVIGMRSDTKTIMKANGNRVPYNQTILLDSASKQKRISINTHLEEIRGKCDSQDCPCKSITADEIMSIETIGAHLAVKLLELDHTLGPDMILEDRGPLDAMKGHFKSLKTKDKDLFAGILYIVLVGFYDEHNFNTYIAKQFSIKEKNLTRKGIEKYTMKIEPPNDDCKQQHVLAPTWSSKISGEAMQTQSAVVFWHSFLYISAFHACYEESDDKEKMLLHCNLDAILQLVRPVGQRQEEYFTVEADLDTISQFYEKRIKESIFEDHVKDHPLLTYLQKNTKNE